MPLRLTRVQEPLIRDYLKQLGFRNIIEKNQKTVLPFFRFENESLSTRHRI
ncbi:hypothetical protein LEP1GSC127_1990 [Leptospira kirschneri str. 200801925]|nr:hypothetical protein LEP1GSC127_1990 [Leptospira kirschneri str. 200801925]